jgi:hypothetical protein
LVLSNEERVFLVEYVFREGNRYTDLVQEQFPEKLPEIAQPRTGHEGPEVESKYSPTLSLTSAQDGVGCQHHAPAVYPRERDPVPIVQEAGWAPGPVLTVAENLARTGIRSPDRPAP